MSAINPEILIWARMTAGLGVDAAANRLSLKTSGVSTASEKLLKYENGVKQPSPVFLSKMAKLYRRPLLTFYLPQPPLKDKGIEDFRTLPSNYTMDNEGLVSALVRDVKARQSIVRSVLVDEDEDDSVELVGSCDHTSSPEGIAEIIKANLNFDLQVFREKRSPDEAFKYLRLQVEAVGIYVLMIGNLGSHHSNIPVSTFRGFVLSDHVAPFVVINNLDAKAAWSFTLLHELAHLCLGETGISGGYSDRSVEQLCNDVASLILLSEEEVEELGSSLLDKDDACNKIEVFANERNISKALVAYRLYLSSYYTKEIWQEINDFFEEKWQMYKAEIKRKNQNQGGGPNPYILKKYNLGALVSLMERMSATGAITATKAGAVLGTKALKLHKLFNAGQTNGTV